MSDLYDYMPADWTPRRTNSSRTAPTTCWDDPERCRGCPYCVGGYDEGGQPHYSDLTPEQARRVELGYHPDADVPVLKPERKSA